MSALFARRLAAAAAAVRPRRIIRDPRASSIAKTTQRISPLSTLSTPINRTFTTRDTSSLSPSSSSSSSEKVDLSFETTPLGKRGAALLDGLDIYSVPAEEDGHPLAVYGIQSENPVQYSDHKSLRPILLLHGRTWSSVPVYHLYGGPIHQAEGDESRSMMESLLEKGLQPYAMDFRGFGGTHADSTGYVRPTCCVKDTETVFKWIYERHGMDAHAASENASLLGWSQGALVAQLLAQKSPHLIGKLVLYGSIYDPLIRYPREPLFQQKIESSPDTEPIKNTFNDAIEDFTVEGTIPPEASMKFAEAALISDPIKAVWKQTYQFNNCDPGRIHIPTLVVAGDQDPYAPVRIQKDLFVGLGRSDRSWSILADSDHAAHLLEGRERLNKTIVSFVKSFKKSELVDLEL